MHQNSSSAKTLIIYSMQECSKDRVQMIWTRLCRQTQTSHSLVRMSQVLGNSCLQRCETCPLRTLQPHRQRAIFVTQYLLSSFQCDDDEDWATVHPSYAATVTHEVVQDCCELCTNLDETEGMSRRDGGWKALLFERYPSENPFHSHGYTITRLSENFTHHKTSLKKSEELHLSRDEGI